MNLPIDIHASILPFVDWESWFILYRSSHAFHSLLDELSHLRPIQPQRTTRQLFKADYSGVFLVDMQFTCKATSRLRSNPISWLCVNSVPVVETTTSGIAVVTQENPFLATLSYCIRHILQLGIDDVVSVNSNLAICLGMYPMYLRIA